MKMIRFFTILVVATCVTTAAARGIATAQTTAVPLRPEDLLSMVQVRASLPAQTALSKDGRYVAYVTADPKGLNITTTAFDPRGPGRKAVWVFDVLSSRTRRVSDQGSDAWNPVWSPDSRRLAFSTAKGSRGTLVIWNLATSRLQATNVSIAAPTTSLGVATYGAIWLNDSREVIVAQPIGVKMKSAGANVPSPAPTPAIRVYSSTPVTQTANPTAQHLTAGLFRGIPATNLVLFHLNTGASASILTEQGLTGLKLSPDGRRLAYLIDRGEIDSDVNSREVYDVGVLDIARGQSRIVARNVISNFSGFSFSWSHDGSKIAFVGGRMPGDADVTVAEHAGSFPGHCYVIDTAAVAAVRELGTTLLSRSTPILWSADDTIVYTTDQDKKAIEAIAVGSGQAHEIARLDDGTFVTSPAFIMTAGAHRYIHAVSDSGEHRIYDVDLATGVLALSFHGYQALSDLTFSTDGARAAYVAQDPRHPSDVWMTMDGFATAHQVTHLNPQIEARALGTAEDVRWKTSSGLALNGALLLPAGYVTGTRYPMIVWVYGGEPEASLNRSAFGLSQSTQAPYFNLQLLASRGYAVFVPNSVLHVGTPMTDIADNVLPGIDEVISMGVADPERVGVFGQSYGGYSTLALIAQSDRFKAAVSMSGTYDIVAAYGTMADDGSDWTSWAEDEQGRMGGTPWNQRQRYIDNSPFFSLDRVHTPVLLEYGASDRTAMINGDETFVGLRRLGKTAELVRYADEGHVLMKPSNQLDLCNRMIGWFEKYLAPASP